MVSKLACRLVNVEPYAVADVQENDTIAHEADLSGDLPQKTLAILIMPERVSGAGTFWAYPLSHASKISSCSTSTLSLVPIRDRSLKWKNSTANDHWEVWLYGYFVQPRTR